MKKEGFSLTEVLIVVAIIAVVMAIAIPSITNARKRVNERLFESKKEQLLLYAEMYAKNHSDLFNNSNSFEITVQTLLQSKYLEPDLKSGEGECDESLYSYGCVTNPIDNSIINNMNITISKSGSKIIASWDGTVNPSEEENVIEFNDNQNIIASNIDVGWNTSKTFTVKNKSAGETAYNLIIKGLINTIVTDDSLQFKISSTNGGYSCDWTDIPKKSSATDTVIGSNITIPASVTQVYTLQLRYKYNGKDQTEDLNKTFSGRLGIDLSVS